MKKFLSALMALFFLTISAQAKASKGGINSIVKNSGVNQSRLFVSVKDASSGKIVYSINDDRHINPASVQKFLVIIPIIETLGPDYKFTTELYSRGDNSYLLKLGADPYLSSKDLDGIAKNIGAQADKIYIDDSILDNKYPPKGWMEEDTQDIYTPRYGSYNLDNNLVKFTVMPSVRGQNSLIINQSGYPFIFRNNVITSDTTDIVTERENSPADNVIVLTGTVSHPYIETLPVTNLKRYFNFQFKKALENRKIYLKEAFAAGSVQPSDKFVSKVTHDMDKAVDDILKNSNNLVAETLFKLAGRKYSNIPTGTEDGGIKMFDDYCKRNGLDDSKYRIADGSGVSKEDFVTADFVTDFLKLNKDNPLVQKLPSPGEGTLSDRLIPIKNSLKAKTGTHNDISALAGYLTSKSGNKYVFCIINNDPKFSESDKKGLEDYIIREAYLRL